ncbi:MAG: 4Fe-4S dicluster domain-containing protein [Campylobacterota bacterium]
MDQSRRLFFKKSSIGIASGIGVLTPSSLAAKEQLSYKGELGSLIDLTLCDGCKEYDAPQCVVACKEKNKDKFPQPQKPIMDYWPRKKHEDWSDEQDRIDRLTPYNWTFVESVEIDGETVHVPRRCMHCDNPACLNLCPFGTIGKTKQGAVHIDHEYCMGGAKCRDACPWEIPQRQAGVGLYMKLAPKIGGGGVMYKCDGCKDLQQKGELPVCQTACPQDAIIFGKMEQIEQLAKQRAKKIGGYIYGLDQGGGTSTVYVSKHPFEKINEKIMQNKANDSDKRPGRPHMNVDIKDSMEDSSTWLAASLIAPVAGVASAAIAVHRSQKGKDDA